MLLCGIIAVLCFRAVTVSAGSELTQAVTATAATPPTFTVTSLGAMENIGPRLYDVNAAGTVVGVLYSREGDTFPRDAFIRPRGGELRLLPRPDGAGDTFAYDLNDNGWAVGYGTDGGAIVWSPDGAIPLGTMFGDRGSNATAINNRNQVTGYMNHAGRREAYLWEPGAGLRFLGDVPAGVGSVHGMGISNSGYIVGDAYVSSSASHAF
jgi:hypothetical protein